MKISIPRFIAFSSALLFLGACSSLQKEKENGSGGGHVAPPGGVIEVPEIEIAQVRWSTVRDRENVYVPEGWDGEMNAETGEWLVDTINANEFFIPFRGTIAAGYSEIHESVPLPGESPVMVQEVNLAEN